MPLVSRVLLKLESLPNHAYGFHRYGLVCITRYMPLFSRVMLSGLDPVWDCGRSPYTWQGHWRMNSLRIPDHI